MGLQKQQDIGCTSPSILTWVSLQTELLLKKGPSPLSYRELDSGVDAELYEVYGSHYGTMLAHGFFMTLAFAIALPLCECFS